MSERVWYAGYGSNLDRQRFLCYISGGRPAFGRKVHEGSADSTPPAADRFITVRRRLYFALPGGAVRTENWGYGGVAFMDPTTDEAASTICRIWLITRAQYEDVKRQEGPAWYDEEIEVDRVDGIPVLTISHSSRLENVVPPSAAYLKTIALGLRAAGLDDEEVAAYLLDKAGIRGVMSGDEVAGLLGGLD